MEGIGSNVIKAEGVFIVGQDLNEDNGGFTESRAFVGMITQVNLWSTKFDDYVLFTMSRDCCPTMGSRVKWRPFQNAFHGSVQLINGPNTACRVSIISPFVPPGEGVLRYISYIGMCRGIWYGFGGSESLNGVSILALSGIVIPV